jgi:hypothetical protein
MALLPVVFAVLVCVSMAKAQDHVSAMDMALALVDVSSFELLESEPPAYSGPASAQLISDWDAADEAFEAELHPDGALKLALGESGGPALDAVLKFTVRAKVRTVAKRPLDTSGSGGWRVTTMRHPTRTPMG